MRLNAYILAADPAWIEASVLSYYDLVQKIIVSYDGDGRGWTGEPIAAETCLERLRRIDRAGKLIYIPGHFGRVGHDPMANDTHQRQCALEQASSDADWVLQIDTDEVLADPRTFVESVEAAEAIGAGAMTYPSRWLYCQVGLGKRCFLEECRRGWRVATSYPGPMAVRAGTPLSLSRRTNAKLYHVDLADHVTNGAILPGQLVDRRIKPCQSIYHFSWVRDESWLRNKFKTWSHAYDRDWNPVVEKWIWSVHHPLLASILSQFERGPNKRHLRPAFLPRAIFEPGANLIAAAEIAPNGGR